jgi:endoglucanase
MTRRDFITSTAAAAAGLLLSSCKALTATGAVAQPRIPRRRGFNLTELSGGRFRQPHPRYRESDFQWISDWGFDFVRLPLSYWEWSSPKDWMTIREEALQPIDEAIEFGRKYGVHVNFCFHRIPGYCVNQRQLEPFQLFDSPSDSMDQALGAASHHWRYFARRYRDISSDRLSFDLLNEPPFMPDQSRYGEIVRALVRAIRETSPDRLIVADGADIGQTPMLGLADLGIVQSIHCYQPKMITHYTADWVPHNEFESFAKPTWPMVDQSGRLWNRDMLRKVTIEEWRPLTRLGAPVHVGEWGCYNHTPHDACLGWMADSLALWKEAGWGWSMWNFRGNFGILDSGRTDVAYEDFKGRQLDRKMLELLLASG